MVAATAADRDRSPDRQDKLPEATGASVAVSSCLSKDQEQNIYE
jgi:hypothetical protein